MAKYRTKPEIVEAEQFVGGHKYPEGVYWSASLDCWTIDTVRAKEPALEGDWIVTYANGDVRKYRPREFKKLYEETDD